MLNNKRHEDKTLKNDNRGLTLVELLVAIAILVIVTVPLLGTFVQGAKVNNKSNMIQNATAVAEDTFENMKAVGGKAVFNQLAGGYDPANPPSNFFFGLSFDSLEETTDSNGKKVYTFKKAVYDGSKYDVVVTINQDTGKASNSTAVNNLKEFNLKVKTYYDASVKVYLSRDTSKCLSSMEGSVLSYALVD